MEKLENKTRPTTKSYTRLADRPGSRLDVGQGIFGPSFNKDHTDAFQDYYKYYIEELQLLQRDVFRTVAILRENGNSTRPEIRALLATPLRSTDTQGLNWSINLALRLWLMINVQDPRFQCLRYEATCVEWDDTTTLRAFVEGLFPHSRWVVTAQTSRLGPHFTAAFMHRVCGLKIKWTTSIHDHLRLDRCEKLLSVFPYKCYLQALIEGYQYSEERDRPLIPLRVLQETKLSLDLLFPFWDSETIALLKKEKQNFHEYGPFDVAQTPTLIDFDYWRDRLLELQEEIFQSPPISWAQLWRDRRNPQQFWTFWVAMMILLLTFASTAAAIIQAWASVKALESIP